MKIVIRSIIAALALTGAVATTTNANASPAVDKASVSKTSAMPVPTCPPDDPNACGLGGNGN